MANRAPTLTAAELRGKEGMYKFVKVGEDEFRFLEVTHFCAKHKGMIEETEKCVAAGTIFLDPNKGEWYMEDPYSSSLRIGAMEREVKELAFILAQVGFPNERSKW